MAAHSETGEDSDWSSCDELPITDAWSKAKGRVTKVAVVVPTLRDRGCSWVLIEISDPPLRVSTGLGEHPARRRTSSHRWIRVTMLGPTPGGGRWRPRTTSDRSRRCRVSRHPRLWTVIVVIA